jgi:hypothetical protein
LSSIEFGCIGPGNAIGRAAVAAISSGTAHATIDSLATGTADAAMAA